MSTIKDRMTNRRPNGAQVNIPLKLDRGPSPAWPRMSPSPVHVTSHQHISQHARRFMQNIESNQAAQPVTATGPRWGCHFLSKLIEVLKSPCLQLRAPCSMSLVVMELPQCPLCVMSHHTAATLTWGSRSLMIIHRTSRARKWRNHYILRHQQDMSTSHGSCWDAVQTWDDGHTG